MTRQLSKELKLIAVSELNEVPNRTKSDIEYLRKWMKKQPHLDIETDDQFLLSFLRCSKFSLERAKEKIDTFLTVRALVPEAFSERDPFLPEIQAILNAGVILPLPKPSEDHSCRIIMYTYGDNLDPDTMPLINIFKVSQMIMDILLMEDDHCVVGGMKNWSNCKNAPIKYLAQLTPLVAKETTSLLEHVYPFRVNNVCITNCPPFVDSALRIARRLFSKKTSERMTIASENSFKDLYDKIPQHLLPEEFGGSNGSIEELTATWKKKVEDYRQFFLHDHWRANMKNKPMKPKMISNVFGTEGSFRQLEID
ncbi:hypothetical protein PPYR_08729 [Photinus pyralis]|uniref:CRAL-TRIO domain-containing protein n=1 Tax=Photinus pyralis TaxID=7054 RepID=A0A1Y1N4F0_PHOPY|nr:retinol-binding protein pinta-like [Photinus pyralis]XP_031343655.1 retinol-binding protein pinta-like [Photinus pyralis]XP_031343656.1 retinol-binding protein pinta-like [Photinus pyralis]KAB0797736.1 hypothetical protein PPYR_08729 [Photinus pyralis]